jgi:hypothetical protein
MSDYEAVLVFWLIGIIFSFGFCPTNDDGGTPTVREFLFYCAIIVFAWPLAVGIILRQTIQALLGGVK